MKNPPAGSDSSSASRKQTQRGPNSTQPAERPYWESRGARPPAARMPRIPGGSHLQGGCPPATAVESELAEAKGQRGDKALAGEGAPPIGKQRGRRTHRDKRTAKVRAQDCQTKPRDKSPREGWWVASAHENVRSTRGRPRPDTSLPRADAGLEGSRAGPKKLEKTQQAGTPPTHAPHRPPAF